MVLLTFGLLNLLNGNNTVYVSGCRINSID